MVMEWSGGEKKWKPGVEGRCSWWHQMAIGKSQWGASSEVSQHSNTDHRETWSE